jgi:hypothetical protein
VKCATEGDIPKLPGILGPYKSKPHLAAIFPDPWFREKWPKSSPKEAEINQVFFLTRVMYKAVLGLHYKRQEQKKEGQLAIF